MNMKILGTLFAIFLLSAGALFVSAETESWGWKNMRDSDEVVYGEHMQKEGCQVSTLSEEDRAEFFERMNELRNSELDRRDVRDLKIELKEEFGLEHHARGRNSRGFHGGHGRMRY